MIIAQKNPLTHPLWGLGFRPFFLLGSALASGLMLIWLAVLSGWLLPPYPNAILWHAHEMIFGFTHAIIVGFLLTATQNWTGIPGLRGQALKALTLLWLSARILPFLGVPLWAAALVDLAFAPAALWALKPHLLHPEQKRNRIFIVLLTCFLGANLMIQFSLVGWYHDLAAYGTRLALGVILMMIILITGRVIPFFNGKVVENSRLLKHPVLEKGVLGSSLLFFLSYVFLTPNHFILRVLAGGVGAIHLLRWGLWHPEQTWRSPILAVLYLGYAWLIVGFGLLVAGYAPQALHAWTVGAIGGLIYGMVTRVSLGHTGRPIRASLGMICGYTLINLAVVIRVLFPLGLPTQYMTWVKTSGVLWLAAFALLVVELYPLLTQTRPDGKEG